MLCRHLFLILGRVGLTVDLVFDVVCSGNKFICFTKLTVPCAHVKGSMDNMKFMCRLLCYCQHENIRKSQKNPLQNEIP